MSDEAISESLTKLFAARSARRLLAEEGITEQLVDHGLQHASSARDLSIAIHGALKKALAAGIYHHVARAGVECDHLIWCGACGNGSEVADAPDILQDAPAAAVAKQSVIKERNQRRALAAGRHIGGTEIGNHRNAQSRCDDGSFASLPGGAELAA